MSTEDLLEYDDLGDALREGRALRPARGYRFLLAQGDLNFQSRQVTDPVPLGRQLLEAGALDPRDGFSLFAILPSGDFEDVRLNEPFDLRERGAERFIAFLTDREFKRTHPTSAVLSDAGRSAKRMTLSLALRSSGDAGRGVGRV